MQQLRFFIDTHDRNTQTFPASLTRQEFAQFFALYEQACQQQRVTLVRAHLGLQQGRAFCLNMAASAEDVRRAHARAGLPFDTITEVQMAAPGDLFSPLR